MKSGDTKKIVLMFDHYSAGLNTQQLLAELQIIIERISFSKINFDEGKQGSVVMSELDLLFADQISKEMLSFVQWLADNNYLGIVSDDVGLLFFDYCSKKYQAMREVKFTTAILLSDEFKETLRQAIHQFYSSEVRVVFEVSPSIVAGFVIEDDSIRVDKSLRTFSINKIKEHLTAGAFNSGVARG